jgi:glycosyltransferase involved in cell wall biosynthesis
MRERLIARGVPANRIRIVENWADGALIRPRPFPAPEPLVLLYSGNLGLAHDIDTLAGAVDRLKDDHRFRFVFAGSARIAGALWAPYQDKEDLSSHLAACHVGLVTQTPRSLGAVVPSKLYALMAAGRPVLFIGPRQATVAGVIERCRCGWQIDPGDSTALTKLLALLAASPQLVKEAGVRARAGFLEHYDLPRGVGGILAVLGIGGCVSPENHRTLAGLS